MEKTLKFFEKALFLTSQYSSTLIRDMLCLSYEPHKATLKENALRSEMVVDIEAYVMEMA